MKKFNEWLKEKIQNEETLKDAIKNGQEWICPNPTCSKPLTEKELGEGICSGCANKFMNRPLAWYGMGKPEVKQQYSPTMPIGSRTWQKPTDWDYTDPVSRGDANRIGGL